MKFIVTSGSFLCSVRSGLAETNRTPFNFADGYFQFVSFFKFGYGVGVLR